jgi:hypothetical protein
MTDSVDEPGGPGEAPTEGDEPEVEGAESLHMSVARWVQLWVVPAVALIIVFVVFVHLAS